MLSRTAITGARPITGTKEMPSTLRDRDVGRRGARANAQHARRRGRHSRGELQRDREVDHRTRRARAISRSSSFLRSSARLSWSFFPLPSAIVTFALPFLK